MVLREADEQVVVKEYRNEGNSLLRLYQNLAKGNVVTDTESAEMEEVKVSGNPGTYIEKKGTAMLVWVQEGYIFRLTAEGIGKEEVMRLAETLRPTKE